MSKTFTFETSITRDDYDIDVRVTYSATPFIAATWMQPAEGGEVEIRDVVLINRTAATEPLTDAEDEKLLAECEDRARSDLAEQAADYDDYLYDQHRDRQMTDAWERGQ